MIELNLMPWPARIERLQDDPLARGDTTAEAGALILQPRARWTFGLPCARSARLERAVRIASRVASERLTQLPYVKRRIRVVRNWFWRSIVRHWAVRFRNPVMTSPTSCVVRPDEVSVKAPYEWGVIRALATLSQLLSANGADPLRRDR